MVAVAAAREAADPAAGLVDAVVAVVVVDLVRGRRARQGRA